jgi:hypothetical protein
LFRRSKTAEPAVLTAPLKEGGKGRPTPTRKEAQAAARARAKAPQGRKGASRAQRQKRMEHTARVREGMKTGDERYLPPRDKGPVRRFVRDYVDSRICVAEMILPLLLVTMFSAGISPALYNALFQGVVLITVLDTLWLVTRLRRELRRRFPDENTRGAVGYGVLRAMQLRWFRLPKRQVKLGQRLPERY